LNPTFCAAARLLKEREADLDGEVLLIFQPAEEGLAGGKVVADSGVLEGVKALHGLHVWPDLPSGALACRARFPSRSVWAGLEEGWGGAIDLPTDFWASRVRTLFMQKGVGNV